MMERGERKYVLGTGGENMLMGLQYQGVMLRSGAVVGEAGEAVRSGQIIFAYGGMGSNGTREPRHILHAVLHEVHKETPGVLVF